MTPCLRSHTDGVYLAVKLQPRAGHNQIVGAAGSELKIKVTAPPVDAAANEALLRLLAQRLGCPGSSVQLVRGHKSRHKVVFIQGLDTATIEARLAASK